MPKEHTQTGGRDATSGVIPGRFALAVGNPRTEAPNGFRWVALQDVARMESGHTPSRRISEYWGGDIPWIGIRDATGNHGRRIAATKESVTSLGIANSSARVLPPDTVCLSRTASVGYVVMMGREMATSQDFVNWICGPRLLPRYLMYLLLAEQDSIRRFAYGTTHQTMYYPEAKALHACLPELHEQRAIAEVLGALDDKIEANINQQMACFELFQTSWKSVAQSVETFVRIGDVADIQKGISYKGSGLGAGLPMVNLANFGRDGRFHAGGLKFYSGDTKERHWISRGELVIANTDLTQRREVLGQPAVVEIDRGLFSHHVYAVRIVDSSRQCDALWLYGVMRDHEFRDRSVTFATGTTVAMLPRDAVLSFIVPWPDETVRDLWSDTMQPLFDAVTHASTENSALAQLRDTLLPKLMSGELRVREVEELVEEAAV